jgi:hypothetical protein
VIGELLKSGLSSDDQNTFKSSLSVSSEIDITLLPGDGTTIIPEWRLVQLSPYDLFAKKI